MYQPFFDNLCFWNISLENNEMNDTHISFQIIAKNNIIICSLTFARLIFHLCILTVSTTKVLLQVTLWHSRDNIQYVYYQRLLTTMTALFFSFYFGLLCVSFGFSESFDHSRRNLDKNPNDLSDVKRNAIGTNTTIE